MRQPLLPLEEGGQLDGMSLPENLIERVFAYYRRNQMLDQGCQFSPVWALALDPRFRYNV